MGKNEKSIHLIRALFYSKLSMISGQIYIPWSSQSVVKNFLKRDTPNLEDTNVNFRWCPLIGEMTVVFLLYKKIFNKNMF